MEPSKFWDSTKFLDHENDPDSLTIGEKDIQRLFRFSDIVLLDTNLLRGLHERMEFKRPNHVQSLLLPLLLYPPFKSLILQGRPGSGKMECYVLSMLAQVAAVKADPQAVCIVPDRNVAEQVLDLVNRMGALTEIEAEIINIPLVPYSSLTSQIVVSTFDEFKFFVNQNLLKLQELNTIIFDQVCLTNEDEMKDLESIMGKTNAKCQVVICLPAINDLTKSFAFGVLNDKMYNQFVTNPEECAISTAKRFKISFLNQLAKRDGVIGSLLGLSSTFKDFKQTIIVVKDKEKVHGMREKLRMCSYMVSAPELADDPGTSFAAFKTKITSILVISDKDLDWRFDESNVSMVIVADLPTINDGPDFEVFYRWISRAGRFGKKGVVFCLTSGESEGWMMKSIEKHFNLEFTEVSWNLKEIEVAVSTAGFMKR